MHQPKNRIPLWGSVSGAFWFALLLMELNETALQFKVSGINQAVNGCFRYGAAAAGRTVHQASHSALRMFVGDAITIGRCECRKGCECSLLVTATGGLNLGSAYECLPHRAAPEFVTIFIVPDGISHQLETVRHTEFTILNLRYAPRTSGRRALNLNHGIRGSVKGTVPT
jgi:hypothetical protein